MQDPAQCCSPCLFHFPYNNDVMVDPIVEYELECERQKKWQRAIKSQKYDKTNLAVISEIWPPLKNRGPFPKYQDPCKIYNSKKKSRSRHRTENKLKSQKVKIGVSLPVCRIPSPISTQVTKNIIRYKSPVLIGPVVKPRQSSSLNLHDRYWMEHEPPNLDLHKPKSGIKVKGSIETTLADLISLGYSRPYAIDLIKRYGNFDSLSLELGESMSPQTVYNIIDNFDEQEGMENVDIEIEVETRSRSDVSIGQYRTHKKTFDQVQPPKNLLNFLKKFTQGPKVGDSFFTDAMLIKRKTLQSHSLTNINQPTVMDYKYGIQLGSYDQSDVHFSPESVNRQTIANLIVAYCFSFFKNPCKWSSQDIDDILEIGDKYFLCIIKTLRPKNKENSDKTSLEELKKLEFPINSSTINVLTIRNRKFFYHISDPIIVGFTESKDKRVFNLTKGLNIFFKHYNFALLQTKNVQLIIWKKKFYFVFDPTARAKDLYPDKFGAAAIMSFFDLKTIVSMLLDRTKLMNCQFTLRHVCVTKISNADSQTDNGMINDYRILGGDKAALNASYSLNDSCFEWASNKQALPMCIIALIYSKILPSAAWTKILLDKILLLGNMLYCEIAIAHNTNIITLKNMPGVFSIGPYLIKIGILSNIVTEVAYAKDDYLSLDDAVVSFFENSSMGIIQIDTFTYAVWKQRGYYYMFDPYPRDSEEGVRKWNGTAVLSMHSSIDSLKQTLKLNISKENNHIFSIHAFKDLKINLCGDEFRSGRLQGGGALPKNVRPKKKLIYIDSNSRAAQPFDIDTVPSESNISVSSSVNTFDDAYIPRLIHDHMLSAKLPEHSTSQSSLHICDLNSSTLSSIDLEPVRPPSPYEDDKFSTISDDMYSMSSLYDLLMPPEDDNFSGNLYIEMMNFERKMLNELGLWGEEDYTEMEETHLEVQYSVPQTSGNEKVTHKIRILKKRVLHPPRLPTQPAICYHPSAENFEVEYVIKTLSKELLKETNFIPMPDGSEIINGTDTIINYGHKNISLLAPFIVLMAKVVSHKYTVDTWDQSILDYIINCGTSLQDVCPFRFDEFSVIQFRRMVLGSTDFRVLCQYIFSIVCKAKALEEILLYYTNVLLISPNYSCAVFKKNFFYYLFDPYNANLVGLCQGNNVPGTCFFARFTNTHQIVARILYNKSKRESDSNYEAQRFIVCLVLVKPIPKIADVNAIEEPSIDTIKENDEVGNTLQNYNGYEFKDKPPRYVINGEDFLQPNIAASNTIKICHFASLSALLLLLYHPIHTWTSATVDQALKLGREIFKCAQIRGYYPKRIISNLFIENNSIDVILRQLEAPKQNDMISLLNYFLQKHNYLMIEFPLKCVALYVKGNVHHLFDPYKFEKDNARWIRFKSRDQLIEYFIAHVYDKDYCTFYSFCISHIRNVNKEILLTNLRSTYQMQQKQLKNKETKEPNDVLFWEEKAWLDIDPIPWNRFEIVNHVGNKRGSPSAMWHEWDIEFPNDLWSLWGNLHQKSKYFSKQTRGKQTLCNCVVCIIMTRIYDFIEWSPILLDSILKAGNQYYVHCVRAMSSEDKNLEFNIEHLIPEVYVPPYTVQIACEPIVEGKMYSTEKKPDLCDALKIFFNKKQKQFGIIIVNNARRTRVLAFGKVAEDNYFMYDCESYGPPLFLPKQGCSYILKMRMFERLVFVMTLTLAAGDFWIYDVISSELVDVTKNLHET